MTTWGIMGAGVLAFFAYFPKFVNGLRGDRLDGNVLDRLKAMEEHAALQDRKLIRQDEKIHKYSVRYTKLTVLVLRLEGLLKSNTIDIPADIADEITQLQAERDDDDSQPTN